MTMRDNYSFFSSSIYSLLTQQDCVLPVHWGRWHVPIVVKRHHPGKKNGKWLGAGWAVWEFYQSFIGHHTPLHPPSISLILFVMASGCVKWLIVCVLTLYETSTWNLKRHRFVYIFLWSFKLEIFFWEQKVDWTQPAKISITMISLLPCLFWQFLCLKNIRSFLTSCSRDFGLTEESLFHPNELFDVSDFDKVSVTHHS